MRLVPLLRLVGRCLLAQPRLFALLPPLAWALLIFALSSFPPSIEGIGPPLLGGLLLNLAHPGVFGVLALLFVPVLGRRSGPEGKRWTTLSPPEALWIVVLVTLYGFTDELHQSVVEGRDASLLDLLSDFVGALFTVVVIAYLGRDNASESGLRRRLCLGLVASLVAAGAATIWGQQIGEGPWPF